MPALRAVAASPLEYHQDVIRSFKDRESAAVFQQTRVKRFEAISGAAIRKLAQIDAADELRDLASPPANRLEALKGDRSGQYSIRINDQYRVCFRWKEGDAYDVEIADYH